MEHLDRYRMYGLVPYNISPIQQGIQFGHALQEYNNNLHDMSSSDWSLSTDMGGINKDERELCRRFELWSREDKTFIILNGGQSVTMEQHIQTLTDAGIHIGVFREPDLNNMVSGIVFLVPEQVYKKEDWPDFKTWLKNTSQDEGLSWMMGYDKLKETYPEKYKEWAGMIGEENAFLREFTSQFRLA
jgi:hypothetical protein